MTSVFRNHFVVYITETFSSQGSLIFVSKNGVQAGIGAKVLVITRRLKAFKAGRQSYQVM